MDKVVELGGGGSVMNGATLSSFPMLIFYTFTFFIMVHDWIFFLL